MSNPQNILGKFRSYAYHHILMVCNNTEAAEELTKTSEITTFQHVLDENKRYAARQIGNKKENQYVTLIDGTTDARFYITSASWENIIAMGNVIDDGMPQSTSMALEGELEIMEPLGANFLNVITKICDTLGTEPVGLVFVLKTIFVGHNDDGSTEMLSNIKPLLFINYDITAIFDSSGAKYKMLLVGVVNGLGRLPHVQQIFTGINFNVKSGETLDQTFNNIANKVNESYKVYLDQAQASYAKKLYDDAAGKGEVLEALDAVTQAEKFFGSNYRKVKYKIIMDDYYKGNAKYKAGDNEPVRLKAKREKGSFKYKSISVDGLINSVMASSTAVINDGEKADENKKYMYKIISGLKSSGNEFVVEYHIKRYEMLELPYDAAFEGKEFTPIPGQSIEFNYIFTGKNVDIKEFDIKMEMGMAFWQQTSTTDTSPNAHTATSGTTTNIARGTGAKKIAGTGNKPRPLTPLFLGTKIKSPLARNTRNPIKSAEFQARLNRWAAFETIEAKMTIYGNPQLLDEMSLLPSDLSKKALTEEQIKKLEGKGNINPRWFSVPSLTKVNIKMPVDTNDVNTEYRDFWYTGYYVLFAVKHIFSNGEFLQELDMMSLPVADKLEKTTKDEEKILTEDQIKKNKETAKIAYKEICEKFDLTFQDTSDPDTGEGEKVETEEGVQTVADDADLAAEVELPDMSKKVQDRKSVKDSRTDRSKDCFI